MLLQMNKLGGSFGLCVLLPVRICELLGFLLLQLELDSCELELFLLELCLLTLLVCSLFASLLALQAK